MISLPPVTIKVNPGPPLSIMFFSSKPCHSFRQKSMCKSPTISTISGCRWIRIPLVPEPSDQNALQENRKEGWEFPPLSSVFPFDPAPSDQNAADDFHYFRMPMDSNSTRSRAK